MTRIFIALALMGLASPAFASGEDNLDDISVDDGKNTKGKAEDLPTRSGPKSLGAEPEEEFDLLSEDAADAEPPELLGGFDEGGLPPEEPRFDGPVDTFVPPSATRNDVDILGDVSESPDDDFMPDFTADTPRKQASRPAVKGPGAVSLDVAGKEPLDDNYPVSLIAVDRDAVVIELPVLIGKSRAGFTKDFVLGGDVYVGDTKVAGVKVDITKASLAEFGPSFVFLKVLAPVVERDGQVTIKVTRNGEELFARSTPYTLK